MKLYGAVLSALALSGPALAQAGSWTETFDNGDNYTIRANRVDWLSTPKRVWISGSHQKNKNVAYRSSSQLLEFDCSGNVSVIAFTTYDASGNETSNMNSRQPPELVKPNTLREWAQNIIC